MRRAILVIALLSVVVMAFGCGDPTVDTSTEESMTSSIARARQSLPVEKRKQFDEAIRILAYNQIDFNSLLTPKAPGAGNFEDKIKDTIDGKTAEQIIAEASAIKLEREKKEKEQAIQEIAELEEKRRASMEAREQLKLFEVIRSRFYKRERSYIGEEPIIELTVKNGTSHAVARAYFKGTIASPDRSVPWFQDDFNYSISGGLEPGEEASWVLAPNRYSGWGSVDAPPEAIFTVTVERLDGAGGEPIFSTAVFGEREEKRLDWLKNHYNIK
jgi:hypothetical protein